MTAVLYQYVARDASGQTQTATVRAGGRGEAFGQLASRGLTVLTLREAEEGAGAGGARGRGRRVRARDVAHFTAQLSVLVSARISIGDGLQSIAEQEPNPRFAAVIMDVARRIQSGEGLAASLAAHPGVFTSVYVETIRAAEKSGTLTKVLDHLSEMMERSEETRRQVRGALMYPACVAGVLALGVAFLLGVVVPKFSRMFESRGVDLPWLTKVMAGAGEAVAGWWWLMLGGLAAGIFAVRRYARSASGGERVDRLLHRVPVVGRLMTGLAISRFAHVLGLSLSSGLGLIESLDLASRAAARPMLRADVERMIEQVRGGGRLSEALARGRYITGFTRRMLTAGETSGELPRMCTVVARQYDRETSHLARSVATVIEPFLVVAIAGVVLVIALSIFLPMWEMVNLIQ